MFRFSLSDKMFCLSFTKIKLKANEHIIGWVSDVLLHLFMNLGDIMATMAI